MGGTDFCSWCLSFLTIAAGGCVLFAREVLVRWSYVLQAGGWEFYFFGWVGGSVRLKQREAQKANFWKSIWPLGTRLGDKGNYSPIRSCPAYM